MIENETQAMHFYWQRNIIWSNGNGLELRGKQGPYPEPDNRLRTAQATPEGRASYCMKARWWTGNGSLRGLPWPPNSRLRTSMAKGNPTVCLKQDIVIVHHWWLNYSHILQANAVCHLPHSYGPFEFWNLPKQTRSTFLSKVVLTRGGP